MFTGGSRGQTAASQRRSMAHMALYRRMSSPRYNARRWRCRCVAGLLPRCGGRTMIEYSDMMSSRNMKTEITPPVRLISRQRQRDSDTLLPPASGACASV